MNISKGLAALAAVAACLAWTWPAMAAGGQGRVDELERRMEILAEELRNLKEAQVIPETQELKSSWGLGPAASKVYGVDRGMSIGGYGEVNYANIISDKGSDNDSADFVRMVLYFGYKFSDRILFNSEIEFEHASTGKSGSVSVEFAALDFLFDERLNARAGLLLMPVGFMNELHEPPFYHGNMRPQVEQQIIPSTWRANGAGIFGNLGPSLSYRSYLVTSLDAKGFSDGNLRGGRQKGSKERAQDFSWVGRLDYSPRPGLLLGASAYLGDQGQGQLFDTDGDGSADAEVDAFMQMYELHGEWKYRGLELRALGTLVDLDDADALGNDIGKTIAERMEGYYAEVAYDVMPLLNAGSSQYLAPWLRYSSIDTQAKVPAGFTANEDKDRRIIEVGLSYKPIPTVVLKLDYRNQDSAGADAADELRLGAGFAF